MSKRTRFTDAILLKAVAYRDADVIATLFTAEHGRVSALARGARKSGRRFGGGLQPCCRMRVELGASRSGLGRLAQSQIVEGFGGILSDLRKMSLAGVGMEIVRALTVENEPDADIFQASLGLLRALDEAPAAWSCFLPAFALRLLALGGLSPELIACASCGKPCPKERSAYFDALRGGIVCRSCGGGSLLITGPVRDRIMTSLGEHWIPNEIWPPEDTEAIQQLVVRFTSSQLGKPIRMGGADLAIREAVKRAHQDPDAPS